MVGYKLAVNMLVETVKELALAQMLAETARELALDCRIMAWVLPGNGLGIA
jgi:hypothetical protein